MSVKQKLKVMKEVDERNAKRIEAMKAEATGKVRKEGKHDRQVHIR